MTIGAASMQPNRSNQSGLANPALNSSAFERGIAQAGAAERTGMTALGAYAKSGFLLVLAIAAGVFGWSEVDVITVNGQQVGLQPSWTWLAFLLTFIFGIAGVFAVRSLWIIGPLYALSEGALLGIASHYFNLKWDGIVPQAMVATIAVFTATLILYSVGVIKVTEKFAMGVTIALGAVALVYLTAWIISLFGVDFQYWNDPNPWAIVLAGAIVILGALTLPLSFEFIKQAAASGAPKYMEWYAAYGLMLSIIWMYISILRLLALLRASQ
jgi:uncharacterized YccA/Bax inhibitor family protein